MYRFSSFLGWDSRVSRILANEKPLFQNSPSIAPCLKTEEKESESEGETIETGWSVSMSRVLIQFYSENPLLWDKNHNNSIIKNKITRLLRKSAILFSGYQAYAVRLFSADPTIWFKSFRFASAMNRDQGSSVPVAIHSLPSFKPKPGNCG